MSSAVHNLQKAIVGGKESLTQLLRQTKLIAAKLNLDDVEKWVDLELNGYPKGTEPPEYRNYCTHSLEVYNAYKSGWQFAGNLNVELKARQPITQIQQLSNGSHIGFPSPKQHPLNDDFGESIGSDWPQRITISASQFKRIVEAVTNELLQWTVELEKRGIKGEDMNFDETEKQKAANQVFNIGSFHGVMGNVTNSQVAIYDYSSIEQLLKERDVPKNERRELEDIMDDLKTAPADKKPSLLKRGEAWINRHKDILGTAADIIKKVLGS